LPTNGVKNFLYSAFIAVVSRSYNVMGRNESDRHRFIISGLSLKLLNLVNLATVT
jgi:hypothetical protein